MLIRATLFTIPLMMAIVEPPAIFPIMMADKFATASVSLNRPAQKGLECHAVIAIAMKIQVYILSPAIYLNKTLLLERNHCAASSELGRVR